MGDYIRSSPLIVIGDVASLGAPKFESVVVVREVVKGEAQVGEHITIPSDGTSRYIVPREAQNAAVLFAPPAKEKHDSSVEEVYQQPEEIEALRALVGVYKLPTERAQLLALQKRVQQANPFFGTQLVADFARMRQPQNFDIVLSSFPLLDVAHEGTLIQLLERIGDERALPLLLATLESPEHTVRYYAGHALTYGFPGAPGVTETFRRLAQNPTTRDAALPYLAKHDPGLIATLPPPAPTLWQRGHVQLDSGQVAAARETFFSLIEKQRDTDWGTLDAARTLVPLLDEAGKARLRLWLATSLEHEDSYLDAQSGIALLQTLPDQSNIPTLLHLLYDPQEGPYSAWDGATRAATFALVDLGPAAKQKALAQVLARMKTRLMPGVQLRFNEETLYLCQLAWLADDRTWQSVMAELPTALSAQMKALQPLRDAATSKNEAVALAALLPDTEDRWQGDSNRWIIDRLGELRDPVAVVPLFGELKRGLFSGSSGDIKAALTRIGGPTVEAGALVLLRSEPAELRRSGMDILRALQGEKMRPLLRRMLSEPNFGDREHAIFLLGYVGTPDDLPLLLPLADFWKGDRDLQSSAATASAEIRDRCDYDVNGPIAEQKMTKS